MGSVPTAANDPIFWLHHCNIDRLWAAWSSAGNQAPAQTGAKKWSATKFVFVGPDGARAEAAIDTVADPARLPYGYDNLPALARPRVLTAGRKVAENTLLQSPRAAGRAARNGAARVELGAAPTTVPMTAVAAQASLRALAPGAGRSAAGRVVLSLRELQAQRDPGMTYEVFVDLPLGAPPEVADQHYVGLINFFGVAASSGHGGHGGRDVELDVTDVISRLNSSGRLLDRTAITLVPVGTPAPSSAPAIAGGIEVRTR